jgi:hypothetical protein
MRKLLPYEHALIKELGITEEEYFAFRKAQQEYIDPKVGTILDIRNEPISTVALVLSILGTIAQVASALLAPRPEVPDAGGGSRRARDRRFAPRYGFDSVQELAQYGDPVNLVYSNRGDLSAENPSGGVRVNTSLLWSAVYSVGNAQYIQMMAAIGANNIYDIDYQRTAFGSSLIKLFAANSAWIYSRNGGSITFADKKFPAGNDKDPARLSVASSRTVYDPVLDFNARSEGFSQAYSPPSASEFGITSPIPIFVRVFARNDKGVEKHTRVGIRANGGSWWPDFFPGTPGDPRPLISVGQQITVTIDQVKKERNNNADQEADNFADEVRSGAAESIELGSLYKLGSAKFQLVNIIGDTELDKNALKLILECIETGCAPFEDYQTEDMDERENELKGDKADLEAIILSLEDQIKNLSTADFYKQSYTPAIATLLERVRTAKNNAELIYEAVLSYRSDVTQMDELVLAAENLNPRDKLFSSQVIDLANQISNLEDSLEAARDQKERINSNIERLGSTAEREKNLKNTKSTIAIYRSQLKNRRTRLSDHLREHAVANGVIVSQLVQAKQKLTDIRSLSQSLLSTADYNAVWEQLPIDNPAFFSTDITSGDISKRPRAKAERERLRFLANIFSKLENLLTGILNVIDYDAFNTKRASLNAELFNKQQELDQVNRQLANPNSFNDHLGAKCLVRLHDADYETLSPVNLVHFSLKAKVFMRIQGRASKYGETEEKRYKDSDNGYKTRTAMFRVKYKRPTETDTQWKSPNVIFCIRKTYDKDTFIPLFFRSGTQEKWQFKFEAVSDAPSEAKKAGTQLNFVYLEGRGPVIPVTPENGIADFYCRGYKRDAALDNRPPRNHSPYKVDEWTLFSQYADTSISYSFDNGPEFRIVTVTEQQFESKTNYPLLYKDITTIGVNAYSSAGLTNVRNLSVFVNKGKIVRRINIGTRTYPASPDGPSSYAPDIFLDTILDPVNGIFDYVDTNGVDISSLALAKQFCLQNNYHMDGVLADKTAWRAFWTEVAPYSLLEVARIGGKETLIPAVPTLTDGTIVRNINVSALFNQGNILEDSYKEDFLDYGESTQDIIVTVIYRDQSGNEPFPRNTSATVKLKDANEAVSSRRTFDLSTWVTNRSQAINYAMLLCSQRRYIRRAVEFKTFPTEAPVQPGAYIYVHMEENQWNDVHSGMVLADGSLNIPFASESINGTYSTLIYRQGEDPIKQNITYTNGQASALSAFPNALFVLGTAVSGKRVFRAVEVAMEEEGEVTIRAVEHPCIEEGGQTKSLIARFDEGLYDIS